MLLVVVAVLVAVLANLRPQVRAGSAQAVPVAGPPAVGDCVMDPFPGESVSPVPDLATAGGTVPIYPAQTIQPCSGARYGEVVAVFPHPLPYVAKGDDHSGRYLQDPNVDKCSPLLSAYLGMVPEPMSSFWIPDLSINGGLSRPSVRQTTAGQHWAACVISVQPPDVYADPLTGPRYGASLRNAVKTGAERNVIGRCPPLVDWTSQPLTGSCASPHVLELLAYGGSGNKSMDRAQLDLSCRQFANQVTGIPDPSAAGALDVQVHVEDGDNAVIAGQQIPPASFLRCGVVVLDGHKLAGSLLALGRAPIPWA